MAKYCEFEIMVLATYRRELIGFDVAQSELVGYLKCMADMGVIEQDRMSEEIGRITQELIDISKRR